MSDDTATDTQRFLWESNGGCERCDALDGHLCEDRPARVHPNCDCTIIDRHRTGVRCDDSSTLITLMFADNLHHSGGNPDPDEEFDLIFDFRIHCAGNTEVIEGEIYVQRTYRELEDSDLDDLYAAAEDEAWDRALEIADAECPDCKPQGVS